VVEHRANGERVVFFEGDLIVLVQGKEVLARIALDSLTPDARGMQDGALAAVAAAWALGMTPDFIGAGLRTFRLIPNKTH
jgi:cyanophycin synthetase